MEKLSGNHIYFTFHILELEKKLLLDNNYYAIFNSIKLGLYCIETVIKCHPETKSVMSKQNYP